MKFYLTGLGNLYENLDEIKKAVIEADKLSFDGALMPDHYMWGAEIGHTMTNPYRTLETWTTLTYLAGKTDWISLGTLVTPLPFRHPGTLAKRLSTLDVLSGGRVVLGVGAGFFHPVASAVVADISTVENRGKAFGFYRLTRDLGTFAGPAAAGVVTSLFGVGALFTLSAGLFVGGAFLALFVIRETHVKISGASA